MKTNVKKLLALLLALLLIAAFTACSGQQVEEEEYENGYYEEEYDENGGEEEEGDALVFDPDALALLDLPLDEVIIDFPGNPITWAEIHYDMHSLRWTLESMMPSVLWDEHFEQDLYEGDFSFNEFLLHYVIEIALERRSMAVLFEELGQELPEDFNELLIEEVMAAFAVDEEGLAEILYESRIDEETFILLNVAGYQQTRIFELIEVSQDVLDEAIEARGVLRAKHILIQVPAGEDDPEATALIWEIHGQLAGLSGEALFARFDELILEYGEDPGMFSNPDGYTFEPGVMVPEFTAGTQALGLGEMSEPIRAHHGYHIILRLPVEIDATVMMSGGQAPETVRQLAAAGEVRQALEEIRQGLSYTPLPILERIVPNLFFQAQDAQFMGLLEE